MTFLFNHAAITMIYSLKHLFKSRLKVGIAFCAIFFLASCAPSAKLIAEQRGFIPQRVKGGQFALQTYQKITDPNLPYVIYIEGDGLAFRRKRPSVNPTPIRATMLLLATMDSRPNVVYLARPCQYLLHENGSACNYHYWTDKRMSEDSVAAINEAINNISHGKSVDLIGFSGGGGLAVLIAARNSHVKSIVTIAGNLDHKSFNEYHKVTQMPASLNPIDYAQKVSTIPQLHLSGGNDKVVPPFIADGFVKAAHSSCVHKEVVASAGHHEGWEQVWPALLNKKPVCK